MYWINSNSGDYVVKNNNGEYTLVLLSVRPYHINSDGEMVYEKYLPQENIKITPEQFNALRGFIPIKYKKLFNNRQRKTYGPTLSDGTKGRPTRVTVPSVAELRQQKLKELGL